MYIRTLCKGVEMHKFLIIVLIDLHINPLSTKVSIFVVRISFIVSHIIISKTIRVNLENLLNYKEINYLLVLTKLRNLWSDSYWGLSGRGWHRGTRDLHGCWWLCN